MYILSFDIGGTSIKYGILDDKGTIFERGKFTTPKDNIDDLINGLADVKDKYSSKFKFEGIAISAPGAVDNENGVIGGSSAVPCIHNFNIKKRIQEELGLSVSMENDANCAGLAEVWIGAAKKNKDVIFVVCGSGIGGAVIKDRKIHKGAHLHGGEFGYMIICEKYGIFSDTASPVNVSKRIAERKGIDSQKFNFQKALELEKQGDEIAHEEIKGFYYYLAMGLYNLQYIYDPEVIVLGGGVSGMKGLVEKVNAEMDNILKKVKIARIKPEIKVCEFKNDANLIGAVYNYLVEYKL